MKLKFNLVKFNGNLIQFSWNYIYSIHLEFIWNLIQLEINRNLIYSIQLEFN